MSNFKDHFSSHATTYRQARPQYPETLFATLSQHTRAHFKAWDAGCGNGQASTVLAKHFEQVYATDPSAAQIANCQPHPRVCYTVELAEQCSLTDQSVDLITVAQALHWFDLDRFHDEVRRVLKPDGIIAQWGYAECQVTPEIDAVCAVLYRDVLGAYWPPERRYVEARYQTLAFPFQTITLPVFDMIQYWTLLQYLAYLESWSALQRFRRERSSDPMLELMPDFIAAWGSSSQIRPVHWSLFVRAGRLPSGLS